MTADCAVLPSPVAPVRSVAPLRPVLSPPDSARLDRDLALDELGARIVGLAGQLAAATCRWLLLVADFDAREGCDRSGLPSTARWLSHACGVSHRTAVEHVRVARALAAFPALADEMGSGRLSYSHIRVISRLARTGEDAVVADLIEVARTGTVSQLESVVRGLRTVEDHERDGLPRPEPYLAHNWTSQAQWGATLRLDPEDGALVQSVLETITRDESISLAAALVRMAEIAFARNRVGATRCWPAQLRRRRHRSALT